MFNFQTAVQSETFLLFGRNRSCAQNRRDAFLSYVQITPYGPGCFSTLVAYLVWTKIGCLQRVA